MNKFLVLGILFGLYSCDDGDLQIEEVDFEAVNIQSCTDFDDPTKATLFFKIDADEALLLNLAPGLIQNQISEPGTLTSTIPEPSSLTYRFFSDDVTDAYFCDALPPLEPNVLKENAATAGNVIIETRIDTLTAETKDYSHTISINNLSLVNDQNEQLTDLSTLEYGDFITKPLNSARLNFPFSNYLDLDTAECTAAPIPGSQRLYKILGDEFISLDIPLTADIFKNEETPEDEPKTFDLSDGEIFNYTVSNTLNIQDFTCDTTFADIESWRFVSTAGSLNVETIAADTDVNGDTTYTHIITLVDMVLTIKAISEDTKDVKLAVIPNVFFGTYTTVQ